MINKKSKNLRALALTQIFSLVLEIFAFTFIFGMSLGEVSGAGTPSMAVAPISHPAPATTANRGAIKEETFTTSGGAVYKTVINADKSYSIYVKESGSEEFQFKSEGMNYEDITLPGGSTKVDLEGLVTANAQKPDSKQPVTIAKTESVSNPSDEQLSQDIGSSFTLVKEKTPTANPNAYSFFGVGISSEHPIAGNLLEGLYWASLSWGLVKVLGEMDIVSPSMSKALGNALFVGIMAGKTSMATMSYFEYTKAGESWYQVSPGTASTAIGILAAYLIFANQYKDTKTHEETIEFKCMAWQAPLTADKSERAKDCNTCNTDILKPCSEYRCKALGQSCKMINEGTALMKCIDGSIDDVNSPGIKPFNEVLTNGYSYEPVRNRPAGKGTGQAAGMGIKYNGGCLKSWTPFDFGIITFDKLGQNQPAQCKMDFNHTANFDAMTYWMGGSNLFIENHSQRISLPGTADLNSEFPEIENDGEYKMYIRCRNGNGNANDDEFVVSFCIDKTPDLTAPVIAAASPAKDSPVLYKIDNVAATIYTNEPANCKWARKDSSYENMENSFTCSNDVWNMNAEALYPCTATLTGIKDKEANKFYFKCRDLSPQNNTMSDSYEYSLIGTQPLTILSTKPTGTIGSATSTGSVDFEVKTDNGYKNGEATCAYSTTKTEGTYVDMFDTGEKNVHAQSLDLVGGTYKYYFKCIDLGGNTAYNATSFTVYIDKYAPEVVRAYNLESKLKLMTNEDAVCKYSTTSCNFDINTEGIISMPFDWTREHWAEWKTDQTYYIKCRDKFNNQPNPDACSIIAKPYELSKKA